jgi:hypothetical protein
MSGMEPAIISAALAGVSTIQGVQQAKSQSKAAAAQARMQLERMEKERQIGERNEKDNLQRKLAAQRARFGASGLISSNSADAVLDGFREESEQRIADGRWFYDRNVQKTNQAQSNNQSSNAYAASSAILNGLNKIL